MTTAEAVKTTVTLPPYNITHYGEGRMTPDQAEAVAARILELGAQSAFTKDGRAPTAAEQEAFKDGRLAGFDRQPRDRYDRLVFIYVRGKVEQAFEEAGFDPNSNEDRRLVDTFLGPVREARAALAKEAARVKHEAAVEAFLADYPASPALERRIREETKFGLRGACVPALNPMKWADRLNRVTNPYGGKTTADAPYNPEPSGYKLLLDKAVAVSSTQEAYADMFTDLIPVEIVGPTDRDAALRNLSAIARKLQTHNGLAGSGCTFGFTLSENDDGCYVVMGTRSSISD